MDEDKLVRELRDLEGKIDQLRKERDLLKNDVDYIERVIREEMGLVRPGESIYKVVAAEDQVAPSTENAISDAENTPSDITLKQ